MRPGKLGYEALILGDAVTGEAREVAQQHAELARAAKDAGRRVAIISGGELSVTVLNAKGRGGRYAGICPGARHCARRT